MKMPEKIDSTLFASCGMNCQVCYVYLDERCPGCLHISDKKPNHCRVCKIKNCCASKEIPHCYACPEFPCKLIKNMEKSYNKRYNTSLIDNSLSVREQGLNAFMEADRKKWLCTQCGGAFSLHDGICSDCKEPRQKFDKGSDSMEINEKIAMLYDKDISLAYANLQELEALSQRKDTLYPYLDEFIAMLKSEKYVIRVRGFRLLCKQAKWDTGNKINASIDAILDAVVDEKPTGVRQNLKALEDIAVHKPELHGKITQKVLSIDCMQFKDTMQGLIMKDIDHLLQVIAQQ